MAKTALCLSEQAVETRLQQLHVNTTGLAFLGTPHRGSGLAPFAAGVAQILKAARKRVNIEILSVLQRDSEVLADIDASFSLWLRKRRDRVEVTCFSEEHPLPGIGLVRTLAPVTSHPFMADWVVACSGCVQGIITNQRTPMVHHSGQPHGGCPQMLCSLADRACFIYPDLIL